MNAIIVTIVILFVCTNVNGVTKNVYQLLHSARRTDDVLTSCDPPNIISCARHCDEYAGCAGFNYDGDQMRCELLGNTSGHDSLPYSRQWQLFEGKIQEQNLIHVHVHYFSSGHMVRC